MVNMCHFEMFVYLKAQICIDLLIYFMFIAWNISEGMVSHVLFNLTVVRHKNILKERTMYFERNKNRKDVIHSLCIGISGTSIRSTAIATRLVYTMRSVSLCGECL